ncbi:hypothetical protein H2203_000169 [Taxawa tesnikishii (nom. ined.)]|nr:hypothetical protein H2203_000169 [Dothideales sp. JES 119]
MPTSTDKGTSRPSSSAKDLPPLRKPTLVTDVMYPTPPSRNSERHGSGSSGQHAPQLPAAPSAGPLVTPADSGTERNNNRFYNIRVTSPSGPLRLEPPSSKHSLSGLYRPSSSTSQESRNVSDEMPYVEEALPVVAAPAPQPPPVDKRLSRVSNLANLERAHHPVSPNRALRVNSLMDADHEVVDEEGAFLSKPESQHEINDTAALAQYVTQAPEERQAALDDFICETLEREDFITLCRDIETNWRRIGLGL